MAIVQDSETLINASSKPFPVGIVIPTYNRADALITCLRHLEQQTMLDFEVVIVDDGSSDTTPERVEAFRNQTPLQIRYYRQPNGGPARARNFGVSVLGAPICLFIGDDIFASPDFVSTHLRLHQRRPDLSVAGVGLTKWSETGQRVTKFMRWLDSNGMQFSYGDLLNGIVPDWKHFYTSNLSLKTELLKMYPFSETFKHASHEDMELGYRIQTQFGLELEFVEGAVAYHLHPTTFMAACRRMLTAGKTEKTLYGLWPELKPADPTGFRKIFYGALVRNRWLIPILTVLSDGLTRIWCPNPFMRAALTAHYLIGASELT